MREAGTHPGNDAVMRCRVAVERCPEYNESTEGKRGQAGRSRKRFLGLKDGAGFSRVHKTKRATRVEGMVLAKVWNG